MPLSDIVVITITTQNPGVTRPGFGVPLILSHSATWAERFRVYGNISAVAGDWAVTTPEYMAANAIFSQSPSPPSIKIGRAANKPTQRFEVAIEQVVVGAAYNLRVAAVDGPSWASQVATFTPTAAPAWLPSHAYTAGDFVVNGGNVYKCITSGTSAGSGGPTTTSANITDGGAHWRYMGVSVGGTANDVIVEGLQAAVDALTEPTVSGVGAAQLTTSLQGTNGAEFLRLLANTASVFFGLQAVDNSVALLSTVQDHADPGIVADLTAVALASSDWYGLITLYNSKALVQAAAGWVESNTKLYTPATLDSPCENDADTLATDVAHALKALAYARTGVFFHPANDQFADAAQMGRFFPIDPGGDNWRMKTLAGVSAVEFNGTQQANLEAKYCNYYYVFGGTNVVGGDGKVAANEYIDVIRFRDWYVANLGADIADVVIQNEKVPYDDDGIAIFENVVRARNDAGIRAKGISQSPPPTVSVPTALSQTTSDRANRTLRNLNTAWRLAGAINKLFVNVQVSV